MTVRFDSHCHLGGVYYSRKSKTKEVFFPVQECLEYIKQDQITHLSAIYIESDRWVVEEVKRQTPCKIFPFLWVSKFTEKFDPRFDVGIKLHQIRNYDKEPLDLLSEKVKKYLRNLPDYTPIMIHTQDLQFNPNTSFFNVIELAHIFPRLKFIICHSGSVGIKSRLPSIETIRKSNLMSRKFLNYYIADLTLNYGAFMSAFLLDNVYVDIAVQIPNLVLKPLVLGQNPQFLDKILLGSDKPFFGKFVGIKAEEQTFRRFFGYTDEEMGKLYNKGMDWILNYQPNENNYDDRKWNVEWLDNTVRRNKKWEYKPRRRK